MFQILKNILSFLVGSPKKSFYTSSLFWQIIPGNKNEEAEKSFV